MRLGGMGSSQVRTGVLRFPAESRARFQSLARYLTMIGPDCVKRETPSTPSEVPWNTRTEDLAPALEEYEVGVRR